MNYSNWNLDEFSTEWDRFLQNLQAVGLKKISRRGVVYKENLKPLLEDVIKELRSPASIQEVNAAVESSHEDGDKTLGYLIGEFKFFAALASRLNSEDRTTLNPIESDPAQERYDVRMDEALGAGKTIKESIEKWLKKHLSDRLKNIFSILNELLNLIKGG